MATLQTTIEHNAIAIPQQIVDSLQLNDGQKATWHISPTGAVILRFKNKGFDDIKGSLPTQGRPVTIEEMRL